MSDLRRIPDYLSEANILELKDEAFERDQFVAYFQPQYDHSTGLIIGAEALARWDIPALGLVPPAAFIPVFERFGEITRLDLLIFEKTCRFVRRMIDEKITPPPISVNITRYDIYQSDFVEKLEAIRQKYDVPSAYLRIEITESASIGGVKRVNDVVAKFHEHGYLVQMDDFGSGYSSLNMLKDMDIDLLKLDMSFLSGASDGSGKGGIILGSIVRMAKWLRLPVIAEGVETAEQAEFLRSIGCTYIQGYLYSRPMPEEDFMKLMRSNGTEVMKPYLELVKTMDPSRFWSPDSLETLIFSSYVGAAVIFFYDGKSIDIVRVNDKYLTELGMNMTETDTVSMEVMGSFDEENRRIYEEALKRAIETGEEQECETCRRISSKCCGDETLFIRSNIIMIGKSENECLFYEMVRNVTTEHNRFKDLNTVEQQYWQVMDHVNIYFWEYHVATHEMRPCFRCMRDLGLPAVVRNYPDSVIDMGIIPPDYAELYRDWLCQIDNGVGELEGIIPLTVGRVPFKLKYITEFDELGRPIKAYCSATYVGEN